jgi:ABC-type transport system substrate-binding protein
VKAKHPLYARESLVMLGDHVTAEATGVVHTAPGHGDDDFRIGQAYGLDVLCPVDVKGVMTAEAPGLEGMLYEDANKEIGLALEQAGALLKLSFIKHSYPHDWRTKKPVIFRATPQWFASSHTVSDDKLITHTFKLRDAKWSDGTPVTAKDFEYAWKEVLNPENASQYAYVFYNIEVAEEYNTKKGDRDAIGVKAVDDKTLEVKLKAPAEYFVGLTGFGPLMTKSEQLSKKTGKDLGSTADKSLYNVPFKLTEWTREQGWKMVKNDNYWDKDAVKLKTINVKVVKETATGVNLYDKGDIDRTGLTSEFVAQYKDNKEFKTKGESTIFYLYLNTKVKALNQRLPCRNP